MTDGPLQDRPRSSAGFARATLGEVRKGAVAPSEEGSGADLVRVKVYRARA
jgi:hypothetical protein